MLQTAFVCDVFRQTAARREPSDNLNGVRMGDLEQMKGGLSGHEKLIAKVISPFILLLHCAVDSPRIQ